MNGQKPDSEQRDLWIPGLFILFFVGLACLQIWFVTLAQSTFSGLVTDQPYPLPERRLATESGTVLRQQPNWVVTVTQEAAGPLEMKLRLTTRDQDGRSFIPDTTTASAERGTRFPQMLPVSFAPAGQNEQVAIARLPLAGAWSIRVLVERDGERLETVHRVEIAP